MEFGGGLDTGKEISHGSKTLYKDHLALHLCAHKKNERTEYHAGAYPGGYTHTHYVHQRGMLRYTSVYTHTVLSTHTTQPVNKRKRAPLSDEKTGDQPRPNGGEPFVIEGPFVFEMFSLLRPTWLVEQESDCGGLACHFSRVPLEVIYFRVVTFANRQHRPCN